MIYKDFVRNYLWWTYRPLRNLIRPLIYNKEMRHQSERLRNLEPADRRIFYLGITAHTNLGDMAQHYCILKWINENYPEYKLEKFEADPVVCKKYNFIPSLKSVYRSQDIIVFQSGYTTQDLGGIHNVMHEMVVKAMPDAHILMFPQTVFFQKDENKKHTAHILNTATKMLFLARDYVSFETAKEMMPNVHVEAYPDIVTSLIGTFCFHTERDGICMCTRNDGEKFYTRQEIESLVSRFIQKGVNVFQKDTQANVSFKELRANMQKFIETEIESYAHYKVTITDRYHGTIFSLCAGTPVVILKTNDHKVVTGADWFKGVYDNYVYVAHDLNDAYIIAEQLMQQQINHNMTPYFKSRYYDSLKNLFESF